MIRVACGACGARFKAREQFAGRRGKCPGCGEPVLVPELDAEGQAEPQDPAEDAAEEPAEQEQHEQEDASAEPVAPRRRPLRASVSPEPEDDEAEDDEDGGDEERVDEEWDEDEDEEGDDEPLAAPARVSARRRGGRARAGRSSGRRSAPASKSLAAGARLSGVRRKKSPLSTFLIIFAVVGVVIWGGLGFFGGLDTDPTYGEGVELQALGRYEEALVKLKRVSPDDVSYHSAQEAIANIEAQMQAETSLSEAKAADQLFSHVSYFESRTLAGYDEQASFYSSHARYMLKRAQEFLDLYPDHKYAGDVRELMQRNAAHASLDTLATEADIEVELSYRLPSYQFRVCWQVVADFEAAGAGRESMARTMRASVIQGVRDYWSRAHDKLKQDALIPGQEDWMKVAGKTLGFLNLVEGIPGVATEAQELHDQAKSQLAKSSREG